MNTVTLEEGGKIVCISIPMAFKKRGSRKEIILPEGVRREDRPEPMNALALAIAKAHRWREMIDDGEVTSLGELAKKLRLHRCYLRRLLHLSFLAPDIVEAILDGRGAAARLRLCLQFPQAIGRKMRGNPQLGGRRNAQH